MFARCGDRIVYFNGSTAAVLTLHPLRLEARGRFQMNMAKSLGNSGETHAVIPVGRMALRLNGRVFMH